MRALILFSVLLIFTWSKTSAQSAEKEINLLVYDFLEKWQITGASIAISQEGRTVLEKGFGYADKENQIPAAKDHLYRIASISKMITATTILKLQENGKINLTDKVFGKDGILNAPEYADFKDPRISKITIRHLLQHTAGWDRDKSGDPMFNHQIPLLLNIAFPADERSVIKYMLTQRLDFEPGMNYSYSNFGYNLLGRIIETVTGLSYEGAVREYVLNPLRIDNMYLGRNFLKDQYKNEVKYYDPLTVNSCYGDGCKVNRAYGGFNLHAMDAHGGWIASAPDLVRFLQAIDGQPQVPDLLSMSSLKLMKTNSEACSNYGLGCQVNSSGNVWHTGSLYGSSSMAASLSDGFNFVILLNGNPLSGSYFEELDSLMWEIHSKLKQAKMIL